MRERLLRKGRGLLPGLFLFIAACAPSPSTKAVLTGKTMGTNYSIKIAGAPSAKAQADLHAAVERRLKEINALMSTYDPASELSKLNRAPGLAEFPISEETAFVLRAALKAAETSGGAFDPTVGTLVDLWGFGPKAVPERVPTDAAIEAAKLTVGWRKVVVLEEPWRVTRETPGVRVDLSAIAKGYGVDAVAALLGERGLDNFMVEIGGEVFARGKNPQGEPWRIGIETPRDGAAFGEALSAVVTVDGRGLASSGGYRNFYVRGGKRYSHFIDPRTGRPITHKLAAVSVLAPSCMEADAAATAVMVLGEKDGLAFLEKDPELAGLLLVGDGSGGFKAVKTANWK
jgi:thiamine biosynthesis lipoprotein